MHTAFLTTSATTEAPLDVQNRLIRKFWKIKTRLAPHPTFPYPLESDPRGVCTDAPCLCAGPQRWWDPRAPRTTWTCCGRTPLLVY